MTWLLTAKKYLHFSSQKCLNLVAIPGDEMDFSQSWSILKNVTLCIKIRKRHLINLFYFLLTEYFDWTAVILFLVWRPLWELKHSKLRPFLAAKIWYFLDNAGIHFITFLPIVQILQQIHSVCLSSLTNRYLTWQASMYCVEEFDNLNLQTRSSSYISMKLNN